MPAGGLGFDISKEFAERGPAVIMCSGSIATAEKSASLIKCQEFPERLDVTDAYRIAEFMNHVAERHMHIDILVNNAGYPLDRSIWNKRFQEVAEEDFG